MNGLSTMRATQAPESGVEAEVIRFPAGADEGQVARDRVSEVLGAFAEEVGRTLSRLEASLLTRKAFRPGERIRKEVLRFLAEQEDWVEIHDIPSVGGLDRAGARSLARSFAEGGMVAMLQSPSYPNLISLRITPGGREELRRIMAAEAMDILQGSEARAVELGDATAEGLRALRRVAELV